MDAKWELVKIGQGYSVRFAGKEAGVLGEAVRALNLVDPYSKVSKMVAQTQAEELERLLNKMCPGGPSCG